MNILLFFGLGSLISILFALAYAALFIYCLMDIIRSSFKDSTTKLLWILIILFAPFLGSLIYLFVGRNNKTY